MKREIYLKLIEENKILDVFSSIKEMSYTQKINIITNLLKEYSVEIINMSLLDIYKHYIITNSIPWGIMFNVLNKLCKVNKEKYSNNI